LLLHQTAFLQLFWHHSANSSIITRFKTCSNFFYY